jgi:hypothetical protein
MAEEHDGEHVGAEEQIALARAGLAAVETPGEQLAFDGLPP